MQCLSESVDFIALLLGDIAETCILQCIVGVDVSAGIILMVGSAELDQGFGIMRLFSSVIRMKSGRK